MMEDTKQALHVAADTLGDRLSERRADMKFAARLKAIERNISRVDDRIEALGKRFPRTRGPRFPFGLIVLAGLGYALYNPSTRSKLLGALGNVSPAARDAVEGVIGRSQDAAAEVQGGRNPSDAVRDAAQDISQRTRDGVQDLKHDLHSNGVADQAGNALDRTADRARDMAGDAKRGVDRLADRAQDKANELKH